MISEDMLVLELCLQKIGMHYPGAMNDIERHARVGTMLAKDRYALVIYFHEFKEN